MEVTKLVKATRAMIRIFWIKCCLDHHQQLEAIKRLLNNNIKLFRLKLILIQCLVVPIKW